MIGRIPATTPLAVPDESRTTEEGPNAIAAGSDGNLWFTEYTASKVGRMTPSGTATYFPLPTGFENPEGIAAGPDGALWYTALNPPAVVRIATDGAQQSFPLPKKSTRARSRPGPTARSGSRAGDEIGRITTGGAIESFPLPQGVGLFGLTPGPDGNVWFTEANVGRIGRITTPPNVTTIGRRGEVQAGQAKIAGTVNGHSQPTDVVVEYGPVGAATNRTSPLHLSGGAADQSVTIPLSRLSPSTTYRYRVVATNPTGLDIRRVRRIHHRAATEMPDQEIQARDKRNPDRLAHLHLDQLDQRRGPDRHAEEIRQAVPLLALRPRPRQGREGEGDAADQAEEGGPQAVAATRAALDPPRDEAARRRRDHRLQQDRPRPAGRQALRHARCSCLRQSCVAISAIIAAKPASIAAGQCDHALNHGALHRVEAGVEAIEACIDRVEAPIDAVESACRPDRSRGRPCD